jgi:hypothetical protein
LPKPVLIRVKTERLVTCGFTLNMHSTLHTCTVPGIEN